MMLDPTIAAAAKRAGMQMALDFSGSWPERIVLAFRAWVAIEKARGIKWITIEQFRAGCAVTDQPASHKAWGTLPRLLLAAGLITPRLDADGNPIYRPAAAPKTHAHPVKTWWVS